MPRTLRDDAIKAHEEELEFRKETVAEQLRTARENAAHALLAVVHPDEWEKRVGEEPTKAWNELMSVAAAAMYPVNPVYANTLRCEFEGVEFELYSNYGVASTTWDVKVCRPEGDEGKPITVKDLSDVGAALLRIERENPTKKKPEPPRTYPDVDELREQALEHDPRNDFTVALGIYWLAAEVRELRELGDRFISNHFER